MSHCFRIRLAAAPAVLSALGLSALLLGAARPACAAAYVYSTIDPFGSANTSVNGINAAGQIVGSYLDPVSGNFYGYVGTVGGATFATEDPFSATGASTNGINDAGQVVGSDITPGGSHGANTAFVGTAGSTTYTSIDPFNSPFTVAFGISDTGQVVGSYTTPAAPNQTFGDTTGFIGTVGSASYTSVNPFSSANTALLAINAAGETGGYYTVGGDALGFLGTPTMSGTSYATVDPFGSTSTEVEGINAAGQIVGYYRDPVSGNFYGYVGTAGGTSFATVDPFGSTNAQVVGINNTGQIVGYYQDPATGHYYGFLGTPAVPEASPLALLALGLGGLPLIRARRRPARPA